MGTGSGGSLDPVAVDKDVLKQRIEAARALRGLTQVQLRERFEEDGLGKHDAARLERGEMELRRIHLDALMRHLKMPEWWFTADEISLDGEPPDGTKLAEEVRELRRLVLEQLRREVKPGQPRGTPPRSGETPPESDSREDSPPSS